MSLKRVLVVSMTSPRAEHNLKAVTMPSLPEKSAGALFKECTFAALIGGEVIRRSVAIRVGCLTPGEGVFGRITKGGR